MANDFKRFTKPNVGTSTGASADAVYTVPAGAGSTALESIVIGITLANKHTSGITASVFLRVGKEKWHKSKTGLGFIYAPYI